MVLQIQKVPAKSGSDETLAWHVIKLLYTDTA